MRLRSAGDQLNQTVYDYEVELHAGSHGTTLGRCVGREGIWPSGPWDTEPDVIVWKHRDVFPFLARNIAGRWFGGVACDNAPSLDIAELAKLTGIESHRLAVAVARYEQLGLQDYAVEHQMPERMIHISPASEWALAPSGIDPKFSARTGPYVTAEQAIREVSDLIKAMSLPVQLEDRLGWPFDRASQVLVGGEPRIRRIDVEEVISWQQSSNVANQIGTWYSYMVGKLWSGKLVLLVYDAQQHSLVKLNDAVELEVFISDHSRLGKHPAGVRLLGDLREWWLLRNQGAISVEAVDAKMAEELALLDEALK